MFAAARGISLGKNPFFGRNTKKRKRPKVKGKLRFFVPFMWPTFLATVVGVILMSGGASLCVFGYYRVHGYGTTDQFSNSTNVTTVPVPVFEDSPYVNVSSITYAGAMMMGIGCFTMVIACVVTCETRDKILNKILEDEKAKTTRKPDLYDSIIDRFRAGSSLTGIKNKPQPDEKQKNKHSMFSFVFKKKFLTHTTTTTTKVESGLSKALKGIPMHIFSIDAQGKSNTTLPPVKIHSSNSSPVRLHASDMEIPVKVRTLSTPCILQHTSDDDDTKSGSSTSSSSDYAAYVNKGWLHEVTLPQQLLDNGFSPLPKASPLYSSQNDEGDDDSCRLDIGESDSSGRDSASSQLDGRHCQLRRISCDEQILSDFSLTSNSEDEQQPLQETTVTVVDLEDSREQSPVKVQDVIVDPSEHELSVHVTIVHEASVHHNHNSFTHNKEQVEQIRNRDNSIAYIIR